MSVGVLYAFCMTAVIIRLGIRLLVQQRISGRLNLRKAFRCPDYAVLVASVLLTAAFSLVVQNVDVMYALAVSIMAMPGNETKDFWETTMSQPVEFLGPSDAPAQDSLLLGVLKYPDVLIGWTVLLWNTVCYIKLSFLCIFRKLSDRQRLERILWWATASLVFLAWAFGTLTPVIAYAIACRGHSPGRLSACRCKPIFGTS